jgi:hypothetical protein
MQTENEKEFSDVFHEVEHDLTQILLPVDVSECGEILLFLLDKIANGEATDSQLPAMCELVAVFATPVIEFHPKAQKLIQRILFNSRHIVMWSESDPG